MTSPSAACSALPYSPDGTPSRSHTDRPYRIAAAIAAIAMVLSAIAL